MLVSLSARDIADIYSALLFQAEGFEAFAERHGAEPYRAQATVKRALAETVWQRAFGDDPPRTEGEIFADLDRAERRCDGPFDRAGPADELTARRRAERGDPLALLRADALRFQNILVEHQDALRASVRYFRAVLRQPAGPARERALAFARDALASNKENLRLWAAKAADARAKLAAETVR